MYAAGMPAHGRCDRVSWAKLLARSRRSKWRSRRGRGGALCAPERDPPQGPGCGSTWCAALLDALNSSVVTFGIGVMLLMAGAAIANGSFTVGDFALFVSYLWFTTQVPSELGTFYGDYQDPGSVDRAHAGTDPARAGRACWSRATRSTSAARCRTYPSRRKAPRTGWRCWRCAA